MKKGFVYVIQNQNGLVKIGSSVTPKDRISVIENQGGFRYVNKHLLGSIWGYEEIEKKLHVLFNNERVIGEWFAIDISTVINKIEDNIWVNNEILQYIKSIRKPLSTRKVSLEKKSNGYYAISFDGVKTRSLKTKSKQSAQEIYADMISLIKNGDKDLTVSGLYNRFVENHQNKKTFFASTVNDVISSVENIIDAIGDQKVINLNIDHISSFLKKNPNASTTTLYDLQVMLFWGESYGLIKNALLVI